MKKILLTVLIASTTVIFMGCSGSPSKDSSITINDSSIEDNFEYPDNSQIKEFGEIADGSFDIDLGEDYDALSSAEQVSSDLKTVKFDGLFLDIPSNWQEIEFNNNTMYVFEDNLCTVNFVSEHMQGLSPEDYMKLSSESVHENLNVNMILTESKTINNVQIETFEYAQNVDGMTIYTYQPTVFKDGTAYILTLSSIDEDLFDSYKDIACKAISTLR